MPAPTEPAAEPDWSRVKQVFEEALRRAASERAAYLRAACGDDEALRREVSTLITAHDEAGGFLETPAALIRILVARRTT